MGPYNISVLIILYTQLLRIVAATAEFNIHYILLVYRYMCVAAVVTYYIVTAITTISG